MAISSSLASSSSSKLAPFWEHDVFLSFRGKDTRNTFIAHLYAALKQRGIKVYKDDRELDRGSNIEPELWNAIEHSMFSLVIFSKNYASSPWCLQELVKITECRTTHGHTILPVFYDVDPSDVAEQKGIYENAFVDYEKNNKAEVNEWKQALSDVGNISGWDVRYGNESEIIETIVDRIWNDVSRAFSLVDKDLVGINSRIDVIKGLLAEDPMGIRFLGIYGMGGVGKTTITKAVFDEIYWQFERTCFVENVRESFESGGLISLQEQLLSQLKRKPIEKLRNVTEGANEIKRYLQDKKVLIVFDDVSHSRQINAMAAEKSWFGSGSRIIITTRDNQLLKVLGVDRAYKIDLLNKDEALQLFSLKAFKKKQPKEEFSNLSKIVVAYAQGLPLTLSVLGAYLYGRSVVEWNSALDRLGSGAPKEIYDVLRISFDGLEEVDKQILLDIACFLKGMDKERIIDILDGCGFNGHIGISNLINNSLISIPKVYVQMHDTLQSLGRMIVHQECPKVPEKRSRLWLPGDIFRTMENIREQQGHGEAIETIFLQLPREKDVTWDTKAFLKLTSLRLLKIENVEVAEGPTYLSKELRYLEWHGYPSKTLPSSYDPWNLVELNLSRSGIEKLWHGRKDAPNLRILILRGCENLVETPDFSSTPKIKKLDLSSCVKLKELHPSFQQLKNLVHLDLDKCSGLVEFPTIGEGMPHLKKLQLSKTNLESLPDSIFHLPGLVSLGLYNCHNLQSLPSSVVHLKALKKLKLVRCSRLKKLPENLGQLDSLKELSVVRTAITQLPASTFSLKNLEKLEFDGRGARSSEAMVVPSLSGLHSIKNLCLVCCNLGEGSLPEDIGSLSKLTYLDLSKNHFETLPKSVSQLSMLQTLCLESCEKLQSLLEIPSNVEYVRLRDCISVSEIPDPMELYNPKGRTFICINCIGLYKNNWFDRTASIMLQRYLQGFPNPRSLFQIVIPGVKIPEWFTYRCKGSSIIIPTPINFHPSQVMGVAVCAAFQGNLVLSCSVRTKNREINSTFSFLIVIGEG